jgi:hypothetical protein
MIKDDITTTILDTPLSFFILTYPLLLEETVGF